MSNPFEQLDQCHPLNQSQPLYQLNKFNSFIQAASEKIACGTECQQKIEAENLKTNYLNAESNLHLAGPQYEIAKKEYYTYVDGQSGYNQMMEKEYTDQAIKITNTFKETYNSEVNKIKALLKTYDSLLINFRNVVDLYIQYKEENLYLYKKLQTDINYTLTNERKTYYEDQNIDSLNAYYYYGLLIIYVIVVICFVVFSLIYPSQTTWIVRGLILLLFIALPFISTFVLGKLIELIYWIFNLLPKNVYL